MGQENRVVRIGPDGRRYQFSNSTEVPKGTGWGKTDPTLFPKVYIYNWFRPAELINEDNKDTQQALKPQKWGDYVGPLDMSQFFPEWAQKAPEGKLKQHDTVLIDGKLHYVTKGKDVTKMITVVDPTTNEVKQVDEESASATTPPLLQYSVGDKVLVNRGIADQRKEAAGKIVGYDPKERKYTVNFGDAAGDREPGNIFIKKVYPEAVIGWLDTAKEDLHAVVSKVNEEKSLAQNHFQGAVIAALVRASNDNRRTTTLGELKDDLKVHGVSVSDEDLWHVMEFGSYKGMSDNPNGRPMRRQRKPSLHSLENPKGSKDQREKAFISGGLNQDGIARDLGSAALRREVSPSADMPDAFQLSAGGAIGALQRLQPNIRYNPAAQSIDIGNARKTLLFLTEKLHLRQRGFAVTGGYGHVNITTHDSNKAYARPGERVSSLVIKDPLTGMVVRNGQIIEINGFKAKVRTENGTIIDAPLKELRSVLGKVLFPDPINSQAFGKLNTADFWLAFDREHTKSARVGETINVIPSIAREIFGRNAQISGKIEDITDTGRLIVRFKDGTTRPLSMRQVALSRKLNHLDELRDLLIVRRPNAYNGTFDIQGVQVSIGGLADNAKSVEIVAEDSIYAEQEDSYFNSVVSNAATRGGMLSSIPMKTRQVPGQSMVPNARLIGVIKQLYPSAKTVTLSRRTVPGEPTKVVMAIDNPKADGITHDLNHIFKEQTLEDHPGEKFDGDINDHNSIKIQADRFSGNFYIRIGDGLSDIDNPDLGGRIRTITTDMTGAKKREMWEKMGIAPETINRLLRDTSIFTFDPERNALRCRITDSNYGTIKKLLSKFYGDNSANAHAYMSTDNFWFQPLENNHLKADITKASDQFAQFNAVKNDSMDSLKPQLDELAKTLDGFYVQKPDKTIPGIEGLWPHQKRALLMSQLSNSALFALDQGTGKSKIAIAAAVSKLNAGLAKRVLIVAPASVVPTSWASDLKSCLQPDFPKKRGKYGYIELSGTREERHGEKYPAWGKSNPIAVISYDTLLQDFKEIKALSPDMIILDEAQKIKKADDEDTNSGGVRTRTVKDTFADAKIRLALSGTPMENKPEELQSVLDFVIPGEFGDTQQFMTDFVEREYITKRGVDSKGRKQKKEVPIGIALKNLEELKNRLTPYFYRVEKNDKDFVHQFEEDPENKARGVKITKRSVFPLAKTKDGQLSYEDDGTDRAIITYNGGYHDYQQMLALAKDTIKREYLQMKQRGKNPNYQTMKMLLQRAVNDPSLMVKRYGAEFSREVENPKIDRMHSIIQEHLQKPLSSRGKIVVFVEHVETLNFLEKALRKKFPQWSQSAIKRFTGQEGLNAVKRKELVDQFNNDNNVQLLLANDAAQTGINLPAADVVINYDSLWNPQAMNQRIDRAHRIGSQKRPVVAYNLTLSDPNFPVEIQKLYTNKVKEQMFNAMMKQKDVDPAEANQVFKTGDDQYDVESILGIATKDQNSYQGTAVKPVRLHDEYTHEEERQKQLRDRHGPAAKYYI